MNVGMQFGTGRTIRAVAGGLVVVWVIGIGMAAKGSGAQGPVQRDGDWHAAALAAAPAAREALFFLGGAQAAAAASADKSQTSDQVFKNIQVLKGIPVDEFLGTMGLMANALAFCCNDCHPGAGTDKVDWTVDTPRKRTARRMVLMVQAINRDNFQGRQAVTCYTCHHGRDFPAVTPNLDAWYSMPTLEPDDVVVPGQGQPTVDQVLGKYTQALGGEQRVAGLTSFAGKGTESQFHGIGGAGQVELYAKAPNQRAIRVHYPDRPERTDIYRVFDGTNGWWISPLTVVPRIGLAGPELDGARLDAQLSFPAQIKQVLTNLRVGTPEVINDRDTLVVQGTAARNMLATLYFDRETGLLARYVRYGPSAIGRVPTQVDYAEYRDVNGIKLPFRWTFSWLDGRDTVNLSEVQVNVPIDAARFNQPPAQGK